MLSRRRFAGMAAGAADRYSADRKRHQRRQLETLFEAADLKLSEENIKKLTERKRLLTSVDVALSGAPAV